MNRDKQVEEMAKDLCHTDTCEIKKIGIPCNHRCKAHIYATRAIDKGYRRASDVAREIFEEIEKALNRKIARSKPQFEKLHRDEKDLSIWGYKDMGYFQGIISTCEDFQDIIAELKNKYPEGNDG